MRHPDISLSIDNKLATDLQSLEDYNVLVTIFTDGEENASIEYTGQLIKKMVEDLKTRKWTFAYIGTDHDVDKVAVSISITNVLKFDKNEASMSQMFARESNARKAYSRKIRENQDISDKFYDEPSDNQ